MRRFLLLASFLLAALPAGAEYRIIPYGSDGSGGASTGDSSFHPGFIVGNYYWPRFTTGLSAASSAPGANVVTCFPGQVDLGVTIDTLAGRVATANAGNVQIAVYSNGAYGRPETKLVSTASMSTASAAGVSSAASLQMPAGLYWFCTNVDNAVAAMVSFGVSTSVYGLGPVLIGSATLANIANTTFLSGIRTAQTFGTWPNFTSGTVWTDVLTASTPLVVFKVLSQP